MRRRLVENINDTLNPKIWTADNKLRPEVKKAIDKIVDYFMDNASIEIPIVDVQLCGSNASYNYNDTSDLDVHIIANYDLLDASTDIVQALYNLEKSAFNKNYDISVHGVPIEMYVQDVNSSVESIGLYSMYKEEWIKFPTKPDKNVEPDVSEQVNEYKKKISQVIVSGDIDQVKGMINELYLVRQHSLAKGGEFSEGNIIFKTLRSDGYMQLLKDTLHDLNELELSLESLRR